MTKNLTEIASKFVVDSPMSTVEPLGEGFINDTYIAVSKAGTRYILQRKNNTIFIDVPSMMDNIKRVTEHLKTKIVAAGGDPAREAMTVVPTIDGKLCYEDAEGGEWAMTIFIEDHVIYNGADTPELCEAGGKGIGKFQKMLSDFTEPLVDILPGFHQMDFRFKQWDAIIAADVVGRAKSVAKEIAWVEERKAKVLEVWGKVLNGEIPTRVTHNDTKISNILFTPQGDVLCMIDLDTVLSATILNDFGDAVRYYTNTGAEDDENLDNVSMDISMFEGLTKGYLSEAGSFLSKSEKEYLAYAGAYITIEQVLRFLMDYIAGDTYYKIKSPEHNIIRTRAQIKLAQSLEEQYDKMVEIVERYA